MDFLPGYHSLIPQALQQLASLQGGSIVADQNQFMPAQNIQQLDRLNQFPQPQQQQQDMSWIKDILNRPQLPGVTINNQQAPLPQPTPPPPYMPQPRPQPSPGQAGQQGPARPSWDPVNNVPVIWVGGNEKPITVGSGGVLRQ